MSKKDYQAVARELYDSKLYDLPMGAEAQKTLKNVAARLAGLFAAENPRFDRARFLEACETGACKGMKKREVA